MTANEIPSNIEAEESYIGALLLDANKIIDSIDSIDSDNFYRPLYGQIFSVIKDLVSRAEHVDYVTVQNELRSRGTEIDLDALSALQMNTPGVYGATRWVQIILEKSDARRTLHALNDATRGIYDGADPYETSVNLSKELALLGTPADRDPESMTLEEWIELSKSESSSPVIIPGIMRQGWRTIVVGAEGSGKALAVDTPILTALGWSKMGDLKEGDFVFSSDGTPTKVVATTEWFMGNCYELVFSDGAKIVADAEHLWLTETLRSRESTAYEARRPPGLGDGRTQLYKRTTYPSVVTTRHISETLMARRGHAVNHSIDVCAPFKMPERDLPLDPYLLGCWLGDDSSESGSITSMDQGILSFFESAGFDVTAVYSKENNQAITVNFGGLRKILKSMGLLKNKHVPEEYLFASFDQRLALLQGLMDTDGTVGAQGFGVGRGYGTANCVFGVINKRLAEDTLELVLGLGIKATIKERDAKLYGRFISKYYQVAFQTDLSVFRLKRKAERLTPLRTKRSKLRYIKSCSPVESVAVRCIQVEHESGMFLAGRELIPTHNSNALRTIAMAVSQGHHPFWFSSKIVPRRVLYVDLENPLEVLGEPYVENFVKYIKMNEPDIYDPERLKVWRRPGGINIRNQRDRADFQREIINHQPDLVCIGPLYKMYSGSSSERLDESAEEAMRVLDDLRTKYGFGLMMEHHAPKGQAGQKREMTPFGSSSWLRWPEIGVSFYADKTDPRIIHVRRFRGDRLGNVCWPDQIIRSPHTIISGKWDDRAPDLVTTSTR
jgi:replicative DNA helicase